MMDYRALLSDRSIVILYRPAERNFCPACGGSAWIVGRITAECARCAFAIPLIAPVAPATITEGKS